MGLEKEQALSISHGRTRNLTEKEEAETLKNIDTAGEAFATDGHGISRKEEQKWNPVFAKLTNVRAPFRHSRVGGNPEIQAVKKRLDPRIREGDESAEPPSRHSPRKRGIQMVECIVMKQPTVYLLASQRNGTLYIGVTGDLIQRIWQHRTNAVEGFTKKHHVHSLVWFEQHPSMESAITCEKALKKWKRAWKLNLIEKFNPDWKDLWPMINGWNPENQE